MKKYLLAVLIVIISCPSVYALIPVTSGLVSRDNMRANLVSGNAFVDFAGSPDLSAYGGYKIVITDSAAKSLTGYIKSAGSTETYDSDALAGWDLTGWTVLGGATIDNTTTFTTSSAGGVYKNGLFTLDGQLYKFVGSATQTVDWYNGNATNRPKIGTGNGTFYFVRSGAASNYLYIRNGSVATTVVSTLQAFPVLTAPSTGVIIVSTYDGVTRAWAIEDVGFNRNDPAGYTYAIYPGTVVNTVSGADATLNLGVIDCQDDPGKLGLDITATGFTGNNLTIVRCPAGGIQAEESLTLNNTIAISSGNDITIAAGKTVTGTSNAFGDAAKAGLGIYTDTGGTLWSTDPLFVNSSAGNFRPLNSSVKHGASEYSLNLGINGLPIRDSIGAYGPIINKGSVSNFGITIGVN